MPDATAQRPVSPFDAFMIKGGFKSKVFDVLIDHAVAVPSVDTKFCAQTRSATVSVELNRKSVIND
jgi:hypothetical protein